VKRSAALLATSDSPKVGGVFCRLEDLAGSPAREIVVLAVARFFPNDADVVAQSIETNGFVIIVVINTNE
jgi:hypothetical protein